MAAPVLLALALLGGGASPAAAQTTTSPGFYCYDGVLGVNASSQSACTAGPAAALTAYLGSTVAAGSIGCYVSAARAQEKGGS